MEARRGRALSAVLKAQAVSVPQPSLAFMLRYSWKKLIYSTFFLLLRGRRGHFRPVPRTKPTSMEARRREAFGSGVSCEGRFRAASPWLLCSFDAQVHGCCVPRSFLRRPGEGLRLLCSEKKADRKEDKKEYSVTHEWWRIENIHVFAYATGRETSGYEFVARQGEEQICDIEIFRKIPHLPSVRT